MFVDEADDRLHATLFSASLHFHRILRVQHFRKRIHCKEVDFFLIAQLVILASAEEINKRDRINWLKPARVEISGEHLKSRSAHVRVTELEHGGVLLELLSEKVRSRKQHEAVHVDTVLRVTREKREVACLLILEKVRHIAMVCGLKGNGVNDLAGLKGGKVCPCNWCVRVQVFKNGLDSVWREILKFRQRLCWIAVVKGPAVADERLINLGRPPTPGCDRDHLRSPRERRRHQCGYGIVFLKIESQTDLCGKRSVSSIVSFTSRIRAEIYNHLASSYLFHMARLNCTCSPIGWSEGTIRPRMVNSGTAVSFIYSI